MSRLCQSDKFVGSTIRDIRDMAIARREALGFTVDLSNVPRFREAFELQRDQGIRIGQATVVMKLLEAKFGRARIPPGTEDALNDLNSDALVRIALRVIDATSIDEVLGDHMPVASRRPN